MMPHESGLGLCRFVRGASQFADIPVIIVSASAQERDVEAGTEAGADVYLKKPIPNEELLRVVRGHLPLEEWTLPARPPVADLETAVNSDAVVMFTEGPCIWEVEADGSWSITPRV